jgi:polysaccharide export outer membrane protein
MAEKNMLMKKLTANSLASFRAKFAASLLLTSFLSACATAPGNFLDTSRLKEDGQSAPTETYPVHLIDASLIVSQAQAAAAKTQVLPTSNLTDPSQYVYRLSPQDILGITVWDHPELTTPQGSTLSAGGNTTQSIGGALQQPYTAALPGQADPYGQTIAADGTIFFPFVGRIKAAGKTTSELRDQLATGLVRYIRNPQVDVRVDRSPSATCRSRWSTRSRARAARTRTPISSACASRATTSSTCSTPTACSIAATPRRT